MRMIQSVPFPVCALLLYSTRPPAQRTRRRAPHVLRKKHGDEHGAGDRARVYRHIGPINQKRPHDHQNHDDNYSYSEPHAYRAHIIYSGSPVGDVGQEKGQKLGDNGCEGNNAQVYVGILPADHPPKARERVRWRA